MSAAATSKRKQIEILGKLATGGMAEIFLARSSGVGGFQKYVVLKRILPQFAEDQDFVRMFLDEARIAALLQHQNIAQVHDIGEADGSYFFTMEYLHGVDLRHLVSHLQARGISRPPLVHTLTIIAGALSGLHYAHEKIAPDGTPLNIVHRDVSLSNIVVTYDGAVKLVDFGVARAAARDTRTRTGSLKGKVGYMSPEQCRGKRIDRRSDLFSLGVVLYEMATGRRPFAGNTEETSDYSTILQIVEENPILPSEIDPEFPRELEDIILRALTKDPDDRYPTARSMLADVEAFAAESRIPLSASSLGAFMEDQYGRPPEPWHNLQSHERPTEIGRDQVKRTISFAPPEQNERVADTVLGGSNPSVSGIERTVMADSSPGIDAFNSAAGRIVRTGTGANARSSSAVHRGAGANVAASRPTVLADPSSEMPRVPPSAAAAVRTRAMPADPDAYLSTVPAPTGERFPPAMARVEPMSGFQPTGDGMDAMFTSTGTHTRERQRSSGGRKMFSIFMVLGGVACGVVIAWQLSVRLKAPPDTSNSAAPTQTAPSEADKTTPATTTPSTSAATTAGSDDNNDAKAAPEQTTAGTAPPDDGSPAATGAPDGADGQADDTAAAGDNSGKVADSTAAAGDDTEPREAADDETEKAAKSSKKSSKSSSKSSRRSSSKSSKRRTPKNDGDAPPKKDLADKAKENLDRSW